MLCHQKAFDYYKLMYIPSNLNTIAVIHCLIFLTIFDIFNFSSLEIFTMILDARVFTIFKEKISVVPEIYLHISSGTVF